MNPSLPVAFATFLVATASLGADWPQYRGPAADGKSPGPMARSWPAGGPKQVWKVPTTGGFSVFSVAGGKAFTLMTREIEGTKREVCVAFEAKTGKELWAASLGQAKYDGGGDSGKEDNKGGDGPRSTPATDGKRVFVLDARLNLTALDSANGKALWFKDLVAEFGAKNIPWQNAASPLLDGGRLFVCSGGTGTSLAAFNTQDGSVLWKGEDDAMTHATPIAATIHGVRQVIFFTQSGLVSSDPATGKVLWRYPFKYNVSTAASPVVDGDLVYCSAGYDVGSAVARISKAGEVFAATELWKIKGSAATKAKLLNHWSTPVAKDGHLYGMFSFKEYGNGALKCVELATGTEKWAVPGFGPGGVILVDGLLLALADDGQLALIDPQPAAFKELGRTKAVDGKCWNNPTFAEGCIFARGTKEGVCLEAAPGK